MEAGETFEDAVAREVHEETGVTVDPGSVAYLKSQPWYGRGGGEGGRIEDGDRGKRIWDWEFEFDKGGQGWDSGQGEWSRLGSGSGSGSGSGTRLGWILW